MKHLKEYIISGYTLIVLLIGGIIYLWSYEWRELENLELQNKEINDARVRIHEVYVQMVEFSLLGETALEWKDDDLARYHTRRLAMDSMLCGFRTVYPPERIDSLRCLLEDKEKQVRNIVRVLDEKEAINESIAERVPVIAWKSTQEQSKKTRRRGFLGIFGKKEESKPTATTAMLYTLNHDMIARQQEQSRRLEGYIDSLAVRNEELNRQLQLLIRNMDSKVQSDLQRRELEISGMREQSFLLIGGLTAFVILLLIVSYVIIHRNVNRINRYRLETGTLIGQLRDTARRNGELTDARRKTMQTITHELRTPLTAIHGYAELIPEEGDAEKTARYADSIRQASRRMTAMLNSLLEFFRLDSGKEHVNVRPFRLPAVADTLLAEFTPQADAKDLRLTVENGADVILMGDRDRIIQIGDNLLNNALKFTSKGGVSLRTDYAGGMLTLTVEDTGSGMTEEEQQRVFGAFERLSNAATQDGFGLGLSIVKHIVDMLGGTIRLDSEKGRGSRFTVEIPMQTADAVAEEGKEQKPDVEKSYSVLALDDNEVVLNMMKDMYASVGVHCDTFSNVGDMMEAVRTRRYDFMITDLKMPEMNGYEVLELMRSSSIGNSKEIPVIVATASGSCGEEELLARGFTACLFKPFTLSELLETSGKCLSVNAGKDELPDLASLLAYGDRAAMLDRLITETEKDMQAIKEAIERNDRKALDEWVHRLRSSWAVIRADKPLWELYELLHRNEDSPEEELQRAVSAILEKGNMIIKVAREERRKSDEDICD